MWTQLVESKCRVDLNVNRCTSSNQTPDHVSKATALVKLSVHCRLERAQEHLKDVALYYQGQNTQERACDKFYPRQSNTRGLSHPLYAFAFPSSSNL